VRGNSLLLTTPRFYHKTRPTVTGLKMKLSFILAKLHFRSDRRNAPGVALRIQGAFMRHARPQARRRERLELPLRSAYSTY
jgi:hypothetical protein